MKWLALSTLVSMWMVTACGGDNNDSAVRLAPDTTCKDETQCEGEATCLAGT